MALGSVRRALPTRLRTRILDVGQMARYSLELQPKHRSVLVVDHWLLLQCIELWRDRPDGDGFWPNEHDNQCISTHGLCTTTPRVLGQSSVSAES